MLKVFLSFLGFFFFGPHGLLFLLAFHGLHCLPVFEIDLLYVFYAMFFLTFFISCASIHRALVRLLCAVECGAVNLQDSQSSLWNFSSMTVRVFGGLQYGQVVQYHTMVVCHINGILLFSFGSQKRTNYQVPTLKNKVKTF